MNKREFIVGAALCAAAGLWIGCAFAEARTDWRVAPEEAKVVAGWMIETAQLPVDSNEVAVVNPPRDMKLFLLIGQSNMAGRGAVSAEDRKAPPRCLKLNRDGVWVEATSPIHFDRRTAGYGIADTFVRRYLEEHPNDTVGLIPCAVGGSMSATWSPEDGASDPVGSNYRFALLRARLARKNGQIAGILWHQGEADRGFVREQTGRDRYVARLAALAAALRRELGCPAAPFLIGEIGTLPVDCTVMNPVLAAAADAIPNCRLVKASDLTGHLPDGVHFDTPSYKILGARYYEAWKTVACAGPGCVTVLPPLVGDGDTVVFFGDSITHGGRYHEFVADYYLTRFPEAKIRFVNSGIGGDTASGALGRVAVDVAEYNPTWVGFHFGMNDIGRGYYSVTPTAEELVGMDAAQKRYRADLARLVAKVRAAAPKARHIYFTPTIYDDTAVPTNMPKDARGWATVNQRGCNAGLALMAGHVLSAAKTDGALGVDWYTPLENFLMKRRANDPHYMLTAWDRVHPGALGHSIMAWRFLQAQGAPSVVSDVSVDAANGRAVACTNAVVTEIARAGKSLSFTLAARALPFPIAPEAFDAARELGVEESLNRETLRVTGLPVGTWELRIDGETVGAWSAEAFAKGVRLGFNPKTPQYRQAQEVFRRQAELSAEERALRNHHSARWFYGLRGAPVDDVKAFADWFEKNEKNKGDYFAKFVPGYLVYWPHYRETRADLASRQEAVRVLARPRPHRYELQMATGLDGLSFDVPKVRPCDTLSKDGLKGLWLEGEPWKGKPTWVFAYLALPEGASASNRVPGVVLAHGGGGTAYPSWPKTWTKHGYAAIVVDTCGHLPFKAPGRKWNEWIDSGVGGPHGWGRMDLGRESASDQWPYHAVGALVRAHSYLRSLPEVDSGKTGLTGISWGGFLTMLAAGVDGRFKFAMPVYACAYYAEMERVGGLASSTRRKLPPDAVTRWDELFDPLHYVPRMNMPVFWFASSNDVHFPFDILQRTVRLAPTMPGLAIRVNMVHSHGPHGENMPELFRFADQVVRGAPPLPAVGEPKVEKGVLSVTVDRRGNAFKRVDLNWCADDPPVATSVWNVVRHPAPSVDVFRAPVPASAKRVYVNFVLEGATDEAVYPESVVSSPSVAVGAAAETADTEVFVDAAAAAGVHPLLELRVSELPPVGVRAK